VNEAKKILPMVEIPKRDDNYVSKEERYQFQYPIIMKYLKKKVSGWNVADCLANMGGKKIAIYAITEFAELVCEDLKQNDKQVEIVCICDRNYTKFEGGYCGKEVIGPQEMIERYHKKEMDKILVCSIFHVNEIINELLGRGVELDDVISITTAIYNE